MTLFEIMSEAHRHDNEAMVALIERFRPLLRKYARRLLNEDSYYDLIVDFVDMVYSLNPGAFRSNSDGTIVVYFKNSIFHFYAQRLRVKMNHVSEVTFSELSEEGLYVLDLKSAQEDKYFEHDISDTPDVLMNNETLVLRMIYEKNKSVSETAQIMGLSRQAVNQTKLRALHKLGQAISKEDFG